MSQAQLLGPIENVPHVFDQNDVVSPRGIYVEAVTWVSEVEWIITGYAWIIPREVVCIESVVESPVGQRAGVIPNLLFIVTR